ncbi:helix-turn-helix domain-containing protein [Niastella sp. MAH-29]|uniref:Helix-turn-helix domain-containing protein n=2 Tax=Chitinophagaceae TaxID=563835 RepID=A0ABS3YWT2_9BACT|nr:helix-turn-helix domain-containing protein [Niastella soli]
MGLIAALPEIDKQKESVFVMHEKSEKLIPMHKHTKGQLSYVEGGLAYITTATQTYVVPARHYFWIPKGMVHELEVGSSATVLRSLYFYATDDHLNEFYTKLGIYPASELLIQMINYTERWDGRHVNHKDDNFEFLIALKKMLPTLNKVSLPIMLPKTNHEGMKQIISYLEKNVGNRLVLAEVSQRFAMSERSLSRLFQSTLQMSFLQYVKTLRMITAIELILQSSKPISDIAYEVGYSAVGPFSDAFYDFTLSRPSDFRKN